MSALGEFLKEIRNQKRLSQAKVFQQTGITDSRLSKAENGADDILNPNEIKKLASLYGVGTVKLYMMAGYLTVSDLEEYCSGFKNTDLLDADEKKHIQSQIDFIVRKKG